MNIIIIFLNKIYNIYNHKKNLIDKLIIHKIFLLFEFKKSFINLNFNGK